MTEQQYLIVMDTSDPDVISVSYPLKRSVSGKLRTKKFLRSDFGAALGFLNRKIRTFESASGNVIISNDTSDPEGDRIWEQWAQGCLRRVGRYSD